MSQLGGVLVELVGDAFTVMGLTGQRLSTLQAGPGENPLRSPRWLLGLALFAMGQALELVALGLATESAIVATGTLTLVFNAVASVWVFGEDFSILPRHWGVKGLHQWDLLNLCTLILGSFLTVLFAPLISAEEESKFDAHELRNMWFETPFVYFNVFLVVSLIVLSVVSYRMMKAKRDEDQEEHPLVLAIVLAILSAFSVTLSKVVTELMSKSVDGTTNQFDNVGAVLMIVIWLSLLVAQLVLLNVGMSRYEQAVFVPMYEVLSCSLTIVAGILYFKSYRDFPGPGHVVGFCSGVGTLVLGLHLTSQRHVPSRSEMRKRLEQRSPRSGGGGGDRTHLLSASGGGGGFDAHSQRDSERIMPVRTLEEQ
jgi:mannose/fructose/N-acetylgalactosamine-specific phosphotransferase system component IIC